MYLERLTVLLGVTEQRSFKRNLRSVCKIAMIQSNSTYFLEIFLCRQCRGRKGLRYEVGDEISMF